MGGLTCIVFERWNDNRIERAPLLLTCASWVFAFVLGAGSAKVLRCVRPRQGFATTISMSRYFGAWFNTFARSAPRQLVESL